MNCAAGTSCTPSGLTMDFQVQHDGTVNGAGEPPVTAAAVGQPLMDGVGWVVVVGMVGWAGL